MIETPINSYGFWPFQVVQDFFHRRYKGPDPYQKRGFGLDKSLYKCTESSNASLSVVTWVKPCKDRKRLS